MQQFVRFSATLLGRAIRDYRDEWFWSSLHGLGSIVPGRAAPVWGHHVSYSAAVGDQQNYSAFQWNWFIHQ